MVFGEDLGGLWRGFGWSLVRIWVVCEAARVQLRQIFQNFANCANHLRSSG